MPGSVAEAVQDKDFLAAPPSQQLTYLAAVDPDFKNAKAEDQLAYLNHITGKAAPTTANNEIENREAPAITNKASTWEKIKAIPAAVAPDENTHPLDVLGRTVSGAWSGLKAMNPFNAPENSAEGVAALRARAMDPAKLAGPVGGLAESGVQGYREARGGGAGVIPSVGAGLANMFGLDTPGIRERASQGDVAGVIGEGIPAIAATLVGGEAHRLPAVKGAIADLARTPEGELHPVLQKAARVAGAGAGHVFGPVGAVAGYEAGPSILNKLVPERMPAVERPFVPQGPKVPEVSTAPFELRSPIAETEPAIQQGFEFPAVEGSTPVPAAASEGMPAVRQPGRVGPPLQRLQELIEQGAGVRNLEPAVPLRNQLPQSLGSAAAVNEPLKNMGGPITFRREPIIKTVGEMEEGPERAKVPEGLPTVATEEPARQMGAPPLEPAKPLRQQFKPTGNEPPSRQLTLEQKYPDREIRQLVHANGEEIIDAIGDDRETMKAIHDLKNPDVRQALINSGEDMGQMSVGNRKATGNQISRQDAFKKLLAKGYTPKQIVDMGQPPEEVGAGKPGPTRAPRPGAREKTGD